MDAKIVKFKVKVMDLRERTGVVLALVDVRGVRFDFKGTDKRSAVIGLNIKLNAHGIHMPSIDWGEYEGLL